MSRWEAWLVHLASTLVGATGLVYGWMRYFAVPAEPDALANHPWQSEMQHAHVIAAPLCVFACGLVWNRHVAARIRSGLPERRRTGLVLALGLAPMIASGYLLQTAVAERWRQIWIAVHVLSSAGWIAAYSIHQLLPRAARASDSLPVPMAAAAGGAARAASPS